ncbi:MAG: N-acetyltransferase [Gemmatimonadales bacterium]|jgi:UDP-2-acetamido-3-amino-2,3-dideoxy-glucuronate N-acetyltransferase|nr:N-acetyltransferase [Gemmatimonadales bacterium]MBT6376522.1 N-acetyltransferase [Gemmatimonadales bacterium]MBT7692282.1 N-acetyltransferase [Gemmatimonadales bacterium]
MNSSGQPTYIDDRAEVSPGAVIGAGCRIWDWTKIREDVHIGDGVSIGQGCYIDHAVIIGDRCKIQNGVNVYHGVIIGDEVFIGPSVTFTNDRFPRADRERGRSWQTLVHNNASIGANATIVCGVEIGKGAMVGAGSVVVHDVPANTLVVGNPAEVVRLLEGGSRQTGSER